MTGPSHAEDVDPPAPAAPSLQTLTDLSGTTLEGRYELGRVLGTGGMGAVFVAKHLLLGRLVAIKVLRPIFADHDQYIERFLREARAASMIRHRNVVEILDFGRTSSGLVYSVMELLRGQDLHMLLKSQAGSRLPWAYACSLLVQIANGLKAAHARGVIHRDIKPANCFLTEDDDGEPLVKVVDFGVAKLDDVDQAQQLTGTAQLLGTPTYIAPELIRTKSPPSPRSDIYSLGVLAYRVLTGHVPFSGDTIFEVLRFSCFEPVPSLCDQVPGLPPAVEALVVKMLAKEPEERPQDMLAVREAFLALGRNTLGDDAVDIAPSSAISLDLSDLVSELASDLRHDAPEPADAIPQPRAGRTRTDVATIAAQLEPAIVPVAAHATASVRLSARRLSWLASASVVGAAAAVAFALWANMPNQPKADLGEDPAPGSPVAPPRAHTVAQPPGPTAEPEAIPAPVPSLPAKAEDVVVPPSPTPSDAGNEPTAAIPPRPRPQPKLGPSDAALEKKLAKKITKECAALMKGRSIEVTIIVADDGEAALIKTNPNDAAGRCAASQVKGTKFRKRPAETKVVFTVK